MDFPGLATSERDKKPSERARNPSAPDLSVIHPVRRPAVQRRLQQMPVSAKRAYLRAAIGTASPREAIKAFCMECVCWDRNEVRLCTGLPCPLFLYRPFRGSPDE